MSFVDIISDIVGNTGRYEFLYYIFGSIFALICIDNIFRFLFGSLSSIWSSRR